MTDDLSVNKVRCAVNGTLHDHFSFALVTKCGSLRFYAKFQKLNDIIENVYQLNIDVTLDVLVAVKWFNFHQ